MRFAALKMKDEFLGEALALALGLDIGSFFVPPILVVAIPVTIGAIATVYYASTNPKATKSSTSNVFLEGDVEITRS